MKSLQYITLVIAILTNALVKAQDPETVGRTKGNLSVSLTGAATYTIPFTLPKGVNGMTPEIGLVYNSQTGEGIAGWGWNIYGISNISRVNSNIEYDGEINPIDFEDTDRFALDGQRLILTKGSRYGENLSEYVTDSHSNVKVIAIEEDEEIPGPEKFKVLYPDGSISEYSYQQSSAFMEWPIVKKTDSQGNYISYKYFNSGGVHWIDTIKYGGNTTNGTENSNVVNFYYDEDGRRVHKSLSFYGQYPIENREILDFISIKSNGKDYRRYSLIHQYTKLGSEKLTSIKEYNSNFKALPTVNFKYGKSLDNNIFRKNYLRIGSYNFKNDKYQTTTGDFDGDGKEDFITYFKNEYGEYETNLFTSMFSGSYNSSYYMKYSKLKCNRGLFATNYLTNDGKLSQSQGILSIRAKDDDELRLITYDKNFNKIDFWEVYLPTNTSSGCNGDRISRKYFSGDFNGDGISDIIAVPVLKTECDKKNKNKSNIYFIDIYNRKMYAIGNKTINEDDRYFTADYTGDGKTDMIHVVGDEIYVHDINSYNSLRYIITIQDDNIKDSMPIYLGNFNTDSKIDFVMPLANGSNKWHFIISGGSHGSYYSRYVNKYTVTVDGLNYYNIYTNGNNYSVEHNYLVKDFNGDGKDDMLWHQLEADNNTKSVAKNTFEIFSSHRLDYINQRMLPSFFSFKKGIVDLPSETGASKGGLYFFMGSDLCHATANRIHKYEFSYDHDKETKLEEIDNGGLKSNIIYVNIKDKNIHNTYTKGYGQKYPFRNLNNIDLDVVRMIYINGSGITKYKTYEYESLVSHSGGGGYMGFETFKSTKWSSASDTKIWDISIHDSNKRGATIKKMTSLSKDVNSASAIIEETEYTFNTNTLPNKVFVNYPVKIVRTDKLKNFTFTDSYTYDNFYNTTKIVSAFNGGSRTTNIQYSNNPTALDNSYHIGRVTNQKVVSILDGDSRTSETQMTYNNNLITKSQKKGHNTAWLTTDYVYDAFGNVVQKTKSSEGVSARTEKFEYDSSGRFILKATNPEGLATTNTYDTDMGTLLTKTNPFGLKTTFEYDGWQRKIKETNYLGKVTNTVYSKESVSNVSGSCIAVLTDYPQGQDTKVYYNAFGWAVQDQMLGLNNKWVQKQTEYNAVGRKTKKSEPYFSTASPTKWTTYSYDDYGRLISTQYPTGKVASFTYNGAIVTVTDGSETTSRTMNPQGKVTKVVDQGGTITYKYFGSGEMKSANYGSHVVSLDIDGWGRKIKMVDPSAGTYIYKYNAYGELLEETTPKGDTQYTYDATGKLIEKEVHGDNTAMTINYYYDATTKLLNRIDGLDEEDNEISSYTYNYTYDDYKRLSSVQEILADKANFKKELAYDEFGRTVAENYSTNSGTISSNVKVKHVFDANSGQLKDLRDATTNNLLWSIADQNAKGQALKVLLGNGLEKNRIYDEYGYLKNLKDSNTDLGTILEADYEYNTQTGVLNSREIYGLNKPWKETFTYDSQDRLTIVSGPKPDSKSYDQRGRIEKNNWVGNYVYSDTSMYQLKDIELNDKGDLYYQNHKVQEVYYNMFKKPVSIFEEGKGRVNFSYGPMNKRSASYYGGLETDRNKRDFIKYYSSIIPVEVVKNKSTNQTKAITYVGGSAYNAPVVHIDQSSTKEYYYLHRDYLGSVLAITDKDMEVVERRQFGAWGTTDIWVDSSLSPIQNGGLLSGRGYTGHEHFNSVSLIHMNGRMYDANLGRFLSPDNFMQEPYKTKSYNRYSYAWNNPLIYDDESGELIGIVLSFLTDNVDNVVSHGVNVEEYTYEKTQNAIKIDAGLFKTDNNRTLAGRILQLGSRFTWELPQTIIGNSYSHYQNVRGKVDRVDYFGGATFLTNENSDEQHGISIGNYINIDIRNQVTGDFEDFVTTHPLYMHEYGHTFDSQMFGLTYLFAIGLPSLNSASKASQVTGEPIGVLTHGFYWTELRANRHASKYFSKHYGINWGTTAFRAGTYETYYPTERR